MHAALGDVGGGGGLRVRRTLWRIMRAQHKALGFEYEVRWRA